MKPDGLYQVTTPYLCAGFTIEHGKVKWCAPILRKRLEYWKTVAEKIGEIDGRTNLSRIGEKIHERKFNFQ
jgi:hypothetical protein